MAYVEVRKGGKLVKRRLVEDDRAQKGCRIRVGSAGQVRLRAGESKTLGKYTVSMLEGTPPDDGPDLLSQSEMKSDSFPAMSETEQAGFTGPAQVGSHGGQSPTPVIEDYKVTGRLGQGGMGTVWRAVQLSTKREVALKFLGKHRFASKRSRARFEREVSLAAKLTHPNIACVYDSGLHRGVYYYAMELVDGVHLDKYVHQNKLSHREILKLMKDVCNAIGYAHEKGIIHRDLKPSNILVTNDGRPHVVDFGLAKASMDEDDLTISIDGEITGTLAYMSPEQAAGRLDKIGSPTDVYSLGVILHQLLTGRLPHDVTGSRYDVIKRIVEEDVQSPRAHDDSIDGDLESLILAALAQEPEDRYPSAIVLLNDIENYLNREPLVARSMSATYRIRKRVRKYARRIARSLLFIIVVASIILVAYCLVNSERRKRIEAERLAGIRTESLTTHSEVPQPMEKQESFQQEMADATNSIDDQQDELTAELVDVNYSEEEIAVKNIVCRYRDAWKTANPRVLEQIISDKGYAVALPDENNRSRAVVWDKAGVIDSAAVKQAEPADKDYKITSISVFGPLAYVVGSYAGSSEGDGRLETEAIYFLAKDEAEWKIISAASVAHIRTVLGLKGTTSQTSKSDKNAIAAIRTLMDRINASWISMNGAEVLREVLSDNAFVFAMALPDNNSEALIFKKHTFGESYGKLQKNQPQRRQEHLIDTVAVFGPLAFDVGVTFTTMSDGTRNSYRSLNAYVKEQSGWKMYFSASADHLQQVLRSYSTNQRTSRESSDRLPIQATQPDTLAWTPKRDAAPAAIQVNGKPFFVICARSCEPNDFAEIAKAGFNVVSSHNAEDAYLEDAKRHRLLAIAYTGQNPERQALETRARLLQDNKTLLAWFMASCPIVHKIHRGRINRMYEQIHTNDKNHPVLIDFVPSQSSWHQVKLYSTLCDIVAIEPFIYIQNSTVIRDLDIRDRILAVSHWTDMARKEIAVDKPLWILVQAFANKGGTGMRPTPQQFRAMAYLAINHGATGITVSGFKKRLWQEDGYDVMGLGDPQMHELRQEAFRVAGEIRQLSPAILAGAALDEVTISNDSGKIDFKAYAAPDNKKIYLVAVNTSDTEVKPTFFMPNMRGKVHIPTESRDILRPDGQFADKFEPYQTHIYDIRMKQDLLQDSSEKSNTSEITDPRGNLRGNTRKAYLDIVKASVYEEGENCVFSVTTAENFPAPKQLGNDDGFTFIWFVDIDRNRTTGQNRSGNDYNIHLWCSIQRGWHPSWFKTSDASEQDGIKVNLKKIIVHVKDNTASLIFPKNYLPSDQFDWWVNTGTNPNKGPSAARNPPTQRGTFKRSLSGR